MVEAPPTCKAGSPIEISFDAFDVSGGLNFIDVSDLTTRTVLGRLTAMEEERTSWQGLYRGSLGKPGIHVIALRFARFDAAQKEPYSFLDEVRRIEVIP
jgi:hypothetical protein